MIWVCLKMGSSILRCWSNFFQLQISSCWTGKNPTRSVIYHNFSSINCDKNPMFANSSPWSPNGYQYIRVKSEFSSTIHRQIPVFIQKSILSYSIIQKSPWNPTLYPKITIEFQFSSTTPKKRSKKALLSRRRPAALRPVRCSVEPEALQRREELLPRWG